MLIVDTKIEVAWSPATSLQGIKPGGWFGQRFVFGLSGGDLLEQDSPICHIFIEISMKEKGIVKTQRSRSDPARLTMKMLRGDRIFGFRRTWQGGRRVREIGSSRRRGSTQLAYR